MAMPLNQILQGLCGEQRGIPCQDENISFIPFESLSGHLNSMPGPEPFFLLGEDDIASASESLADLFPFISNNDHMPIRRRFGSHPQNIVQHRVSAHLMQDFRAVRPQTCSISGRENDRIQCLRSLHGSMQRFCRFQAGQTGNPPGNG
ncbi:MAG: hypothetical protein UZ16_OP3001000536 [Candidatus Hinthialibacteria bacterium OLB16]|nr:MAG: hypothetical protein UZ16_OP3001000536 [Candidatus Hinthialibacteria bacterium OLB16]